MLVAILLIFIIGLYVCAGANAYVCVFFSSVYMLLFTIFHYDAILSVMRQPRLGFSIRFIIIMF